MISYNLSLHTYNLFHHRYSKSYDRYIKGCDNSEHMIIGNCHRIER